jgi:hypothetical protein
MPTFKKPKFKMEGIVEGEKWSPLTIPMSRLAEYLTDSQLCLDIKESVHLVEVVDGSATPVI